MIILEPFFIVRLDPQYAPAICPAAITNPIVQLTKPRYINVIKDPKLDAKLTTLVLYVAFNRVIPLRDTKANIKKEPVPGPIAPSYPPISTVTNMNVLLLTTVFL